MADLRERKKVDTRTRLTAVALDLFLRHGYDATTVDQIAAGAEVSVRTLYRYFESKDALLFEGFEPALQALLEAMRRRDHSLAPLPSLQQALISAGDVMNDVAPVLLHIWQLAAEAPSVMGLSQKEINRWRNAFVAEVADQAGLPIYDARVQVLGGALHATVSAGVAQWRGEGGKGDLADAFRRAVALLDDVAATADDAFAVE